MKKLESAHDMYQSLKSSGRHFNYDDLAALFAMGNPKHTWNDGVVLAATVWNIATGRPTTPNLVDGIVAEKHRDSLKTLFQYRIEELESTNPDCFRFRVDILPHRSTDAFGSFVATMSAERDQRRPWYVAAILEGSMMIDSIAEPGFLDRSIKDVEVDNSRFARYTIFDNLTTPVEMDNKGTLYLQCLHEQVAEYAGDDMGDLFQKYRTYADCMLEMHPGYKLWVRYWQVEKDLINLNVSVIAPESGTSRRHDVTQFNELLKKRVD